jgi:hypothetical protein
MTAVVKEFPDERIALWALVDYYFRLGGTRHNKLKKVPTCPSFF